jgi:hypothetical protein
MINRSDFRFFHANMGGIVGQRAIGAASLARAEAYAEAMGWTCEWQWDDCSAYDHCADWGCECCKNEHTTQIDHQHEVCLLRNADGEVLAVLGGIIDADRDYRRLIEAELASEAMADAVRAWGQCAHTA